MSSVDTQPQLPTPNSHKHIRHDSANSHLIGRKSSSSSVLMTKKSNDSQNHHEKIKKNRSNSNDKHKQKHKNHSIKERSIPKRERLIPESDTILDLEKLGNDDNVTLRNALIPLITDMLPGWDVSRESDIQIERVSGALTNCVFFITKINYQHLESVTLKSNDLRDPSTSKYIAQRLFQLHNIINKFPPPQEDIKPDVWINIDKWYPMALNTVFSNTLKCTEEQRKNIEEFDFEMLKDEIEELEYKLSHDINSPIVFAHNDTQYGNILRLTDGSLVVVDFEYAGYNYQAFDIANHFCEWMYDYRSSDPHKMKLDLYPNENQQIDFLRSYLDTYLTSDDHTINNHSETHDSCLRKLKLDVYAFTLASHVMWGLWGLVQSGQSQINFDYLSYGMERLHRFRELKNEVYERLSLNKV
ncbi:probable choline kinase 2 isoform X2 [Rhizophagus clarus]|uniref:Probable choline kinase 2 isoform X2 n=1 Tax=Rhizophagus clarus TaxID=94130 RepID=A0A8H3QSR8_9GLOM|nr:probable choline kinase 2 isoform X2 [Rhizophagus clarus]